MTNKKAISVSKITLWGKPWLGLGYIQYSFDNGDTYTMWSLLLTNKFAVGFHYTPWTPKNLNVKSQG